MTEYAISMLGWLLDVIRNNSATVVAAFSGTFVGAFFAFLFERRHAAAKERASQITAARMVQFVMKIQLNVCKNIAGQILDPHRDDPNRHLTLLPFCIQPEYPTLDLQSISFMLDEEAVHVVDELQVAEHKFQTLVAVSERRNRYRENAQHITAAPTTEVPLDAATIAILKDLTNSLFDAAGDAEAGLSDAFERLGKEIERRFPSTKALSVDWES